MANGKPQNSTSIDATHDELQEHQADRAHRESTMADGKQVNWDENQPEVYHKYESTPVVHHAQGDLYPVHKPEGHHFYCLEEDVKPLPSTIFGIPKRSFWILVIIIGVIVLATLGGSIGGAIAVKGSTKPKPASNANPAAPVVSAAVQSSSTTLAPTATSGVPESYTPIPFGNLRSIDIDCPNSGVLGSLQGTAQLPDKYRYHCEASMVIDGNDLTAIQAYTTQTCVDACSQYNEFQGKTICKAVVISSNVAQEYHAGNAANCWLKNTTEGQTRGLATATFSLITS